MWDVIDDDDNNEEKKTRRPCVRPWAGCELIYSYKLADHSIEPLKIGWLALFFVVARFTTSIFHSILWKIHALFDFFDAHVRHHQFFRRFFSTTIGIWTRMEWDGKQWVFCILWSCTVRRFQFGRVYTLKNMSNRNQFRSFTTEKNEQTTRVWHKQTQNTHVFSREISNWNDAVQNNKQILYIFARSIYPLTGSHSV